MTGTRARAPPTTIAVSWTNVLRLGPVKTAVPVAMVSVCARPDSVDTNARVSKFLHFFCSGRGHFFKWKWDLQNGFCLTEFRGRMWGWDGWVQDVSKWGVKHFQCRSQQSRQLSRSLVLFNLIYTDWHINLNLSLINLSSSFAFTSLGLQHLKRQLPRPRRLSRVKRWKPALLVSRLALDWLGRRTRWRRLCGRDLWYFGWRIEMRKWRILRVSIRKNWIFFLRDWEWGFRQNRGRYCEIGHVRRIDM